MKIGAFEISYIESGFISLDGGAMFGVVPKVLWDKTNPADEFNRMILAMRLLVIKYKDRIIITDNGVGEKLNDKLTKIYNVDHSMHTLYKGLKRMGIQADQVTDVILTHLHFDHCGGSTYYDSEGQLRLTFPRAIHHIQKHHWQWALNPSERDSASFMGENYLPIEENGKLNIVDGPGDFLPGLELMVFNGHTPAMQSVKISDSKKTLFYGADVFPTSSHIPLPYIMSYDVEPLKTLAEKKEILSTAVDEEWIIFFEHDPYNIAGTIKKTDKGYKLKESLKDF